MRRRKLRGLIYIHIDTYMVATEIRIYTCSVNTDTGENIKNCIDCATCFVNSFRFRHFVYHNDLGIDF